MYITVLHGHRCNINKCPSTTTSSDGPHQNAIREARQREAKRSVFTAIDEASDMRNNITFK